MTIPRERTFAREEVFPSYFVNEQQRRIGPLTNLRLRKASATAVEAVAGAGEDASVLSINGRWRYNEAATQRTVSGTAGTKLVFAVALDNDILSTPAANSDVTVRSWSLRVVDDGTTPAVAPADPDVEVFRRIGRLTWDGTAITGLVQEVGVVGAPQLAGDAQLGAGLDVWEPLIPARGNVSNTGDNPGGTLKVLSVPEGSSSTFPTTVQMAYAIWLDPADLAIAGKTTKLRIRAHVGTDETPPNADTTFALARINAFGGTNGPQGTGLDAAVAGSSVTIDNTPGAANTWQRADGVEFDVPAAGWYVMTYVNSASLPTNAAMYVRAILQRRWV